MNKWKYLSNIFITLLFVTEKMELNINILQ